MPPGEPPEPPVSDMDAARARSRSDHMIRPHGVRTVTLPALLRRMQVLVVFPVVILLTVSAGSFVYASYLTIHLVFTTSWASSEVSENVVRALQVVDVCLIGIAALVIAADALMTFMSKPQGTPSTPRWLDQETETVDVLKNRALSMVVLILAVTFLEGITRPTSGSEELDLGFSIAAVIGAIGIYIAASWLHGRTSHRDPHL